MLQIFAVVITCIAAAIAYGVIHDQITARVCVEYFTIGHPSVFNTDSPTLLALGWGVIATWWVGLLLGVPLAIAARVGRRPGRTAGSLLRPIGVLLLVMASTACVAGIIGFCWLETGWCFYWNHWHRTFQRLSTPPLLRTFGHITPATPLDSSGGLR